MFGANGLAESATKAALGVNVGNAVAQANRACRTCRGAVAQPNATKPAGVRACIDHCGGFAGGNAGVVGFSCCCFAVAVAMNKGDHVKRCFHLNSQNFAQFGGGGFRTGNAKIGLCRTVGNGGGIIVASFIAAGAAVHARQTGAHGFEFFILLGGKKVGNERQENAQNQRNSANNAKGDQNVNSHIHASLCKHLFHNPGKAHKGERDEGSGNQGCGKTAERFGNVGFVNARAKP